MRGGTWPEPFESATLELGVCLAVWVAIPELFSWITTVRETWGQGLQHEIHEMSHTQLSCLLELE